MGLISPTQSADGETIEASDINNPVNTIANEFNGNIEAVNIKDATITGAKIAAGTVTTSNLVDASVTNAKLSTTAGEPGGVWTTYTPTLTNITLGTGGTVTGSYMQIGKTVFARVNITFGTSGAGNGSDMTISLPKTAAATGLQTGAVYGLDSGTAFRTGVIRIGTSGTSFFMVSHSSSTAWNGTNPHTWAVNDIITVSVTYEAA